MQRIVIVIILAIIIITTTTTTIIFSIIIIGIIIGIIIVSSSSSIIIFIIIIIFINIFTIQVLPSAPEHPSSHKTTPTPFYPPIGSYSAQRAVSAPSFPPNHPASAKLSHDNSMKQLCVDQRMPDGETGPATNRRL
jgi:energy-coupling factor transporter transmembrane protein EcfT